MLFRSQLRDTAKGRVQQPDGSYARAQGELFNSQEWFCDQAGSGAWTLPGLRRQSPAPKAADSAKKSPAPAPAAPRAPAPKPLPAKGTPAPQKRPAVKIQARRTGLLGRIFGRN